MTLTAEGEERRGERGGGGASQAQGARAPCMCRKGERAAGPVVLTARVRIVLARQARAVECVAADGAALQQETAAGVALGSTTKAASRPSATAARQHTGCSPAHRSALLDVNHLRRHARANVVAGDLRETAAGDGASANGWPASQCSTGCRGQPARLLTLLLLDESPPPGLPM